MTCTSLFTAAPALALALSVAGCAATQPQGEDGQLAAYQEKYVPTGTMFSKKDPKRTDATKVVDKEGLEQMLQQNGGSNNPFSKM